MSRNSAAYIATVMDQLRKDFLGDDHCSSAACGPTGFFYLAVSHLGYDDNDEGAITARSHPRNPERHAFCEGLNHSARLSRCWSMTKSHLAVSLIISDAVLCLSTAVHDDEGMSSTLRGAEDDVLGMNCPIFDKYELKQMSLVDKQFLPYECENNDTSSHTGRQLEALLFLIPNYI
ncbi:hypothetical protein ARMGADRAFT_57595 [Armillaria gallica]|uniref:Uncharacterized protein n=1 Tax=Armillaria gallica TaxID=47427 RepID=A0A2H3EWE4_ARMGA|nr:hypothetical protein ARMGADRAFT_57595 [Armillaria gallica]